MLMPIRPTRRRLFVTMVLVGVLAVPLVVARQERERGEEGEGRRASVARERDGGERRRGERDRREPGRQEPAAAPAQPTAPPPPLAIGSMVRVLGVVRALPELTAQVTAPIWGRVDFGDDPLVVGQVVKKGQPLLKVVLTLSANERYLLESRTIEIKAAADTARTRFQEAEREYRRAIALLKAEPTNKFRRQQVISSERIYNAANEEKTLYERQERSYATVLKRRDPRITTVEAPIGGFVTAVGVTQGQVIPIGRFQQVCTISDLSRVRIEADVYEAAIGDVLRGARASYGVSENGPMRTLGNPIAVMPWLDEQTRTLKVIYEVPNPRTELRLGMTVHVAFQHGAAAESGR